MSETNYFLKSLSPADAARLRPDMQRRDLVLNDVITEPGRTMTHAWLPDGAILSVITVMADGRMVESRTIGREAGYGLLHALGSPYAYERVICQVSGPCWRVPLEAIARVVDESADARSAVARHAQGTLVQAAVAVACNMVHSVGQRLARWLLVTQDRLSGADIVPLTQEHLAIMLGCQRTTVTAAVAELQALGAITTLRGKITVIDRSVLERRSCECYGQLDESVKRLLA